MRQKQQSIQVFLSLFIAGVAIALIVWLLGKLTGTPDTIVPTPIPSTVSPPSSFLNQHLSVGDKILITAHTNPEKEAGVQAFAKGDFVTALKKFEESLKIDRNDPEALIYLNNAKIAYANAKSFEVAVATGIGGNLDTAQEVLRGVAQAQNEVNSSGGINGRPLQIEIVNDEGNENTSKKLAPDLAKDSNILAVIGHGDTKGSLSAAPIYNAQGLVMITPSYGPAKLSQIGEYIFRGSPDSSVTAKALAEYIVQKAHIKNIAICTDSSASASNTASKTTINEFTQAISEAGGKVSNTVCNFGAADFNPNTVMNQAISDGAKGLLIMPQVNKLRPAIELAQANGGRLGLFSHGGLYTYETLNSGRQNFNGLILSAFWHPDADANNPFFKNATALWEAKVNARTASAYDTLQAIIAGLKVAGLKQGNTREELQKALSDPTFSASGAIGKIQFLPSRARQGKPLLIKIAPGSSSGTGYDFVLMR
ncbi:ABC transporter substrate-binding protein [Gloeothece verrucosa]|uniref:Extracellular ligand-binding receptor n=1 Tax=Gloeothece verrucosa (strain PCC 7822) TaxID=497965 RepID=E0UKI6_GLOV7|nr:ABC transporter substrate-binding protein [Gloeothece verrucosa]ADN17067.1 Extracellular ligand-binding receptor [Gloeothece verrucosa PCC 7822]